MLDVRSETYIYVGERGKGGRRAASGGASQPPEGALRLGSNLNLRHIFADVSDPAESEGPTSAIPLRTIGSKRISSIYLMIRRVKSLTLIC